MTIAERKLYQAARRKGELGRATGFASPSGLVMLFPAIQKAFKLQAKAE